MIGSFGVEESTRPALPIERWTLACPSPRQSVLPLARSGVSRRFLPIGIPTGPNVRVRTEG